jgi:hypothetical protein
MSALVEQNERQSNSLTQITGLIQLICRLDSANQDEHRRTREIILEAVEQRKHEPKEELSDQQDDDYEDVATFKLNIEAFGVSSAYELTDVSDAQESQLRSKTTKIILRSLRYDRMSNRYEDVVEAYPKTFEWIFRDTEEEQLPWDSFTDWLETGNGVYWIAGKAGSGKSTLLKHVFDDPRTRQHLRKWAGCRLLRVASFFFWGSGTSEQRSQAGCLKALLFQIFDQHPELIPIALPERWAETYTNSIKQLNISEKPWSLFDLMSGLRRVVRQTSIPLGLCFLVDGLDEFDGDHEEIVEFFKDLAMWDSFKACVSSRPWVIFKEAFSECSILLLQNFTYNDIVYYVNGRFAANKSFRKLQMRQPENATALVEEVVQKADGVFLWVRLAVKSLLNGIQNRDDITTLQSRLATLPNELEALYVHLLGLIEPHYLPWTSKVLQIVRACRELGTCCFGTSRSFIGVIPLTLGCLYLAIEESGYDGVLSSSSLSVTKMNESYLDLEVHLAARAAGLLEISHPLYGQVSAGSSVGYLHLTCRDYLESNSIWPKILVHTAGLKFNPHTAMFKACLRLLQSSPNIHGELKLHTEGEADFTSPTMDREEQLIHSALTYATQISPHEQLSLLDLLDRACEVLYASPIETGKHWSNNLFAQGESPLESFLDLAAIYHLERYVEEKLKRQASDTAKITAASLLFKLLPKTHWGAAWPGPSPEIVTMLLKYGADPNQKHNYFRTSVYENTIRYILNSPLPDDDDATNK